MTQRIRESFDAYLQRIGLADAGPVQKRELRRAFYAGCWEVLCAAGASRVEDGLTNIGANLMRDLRAECEEFGNRMIEGRDWT
jgi:hypothetical protein